MEVVMTITRSYNNLNFLVFLTLNVLQALITG